MPHLYIFLGLMLVALLGSCFITSHRHQFSYGISVSTLARTGADCYSIFNVRQTAPRQIKV